MLPSILDRRKLEPPVMLQLITSCCSHQVSDRDCQGKTDGLPNEGLESMWLRLVHAKIT